MQNIIEENRKMFCEELGITQENFIYPEQRHTDTVAVAELGKTYYPEADALILTNHEQAVFLNFADCTPLIAYDKKQNIGAVIHAGWKGTVGRIGTKTILKMMDDFNTDIRDVRVAIGPAISVFCYEVKEDVFNMSMVSVKNNKGLYEIRDGKIYVNLKEINKRQLEELGVKYIDVCPYCTSCNNDLFYSRSEERR